MGIVDKKNNYITWPSIGWSLFVALIINYVINEIIFINNTFACSEALDLKSCFSFGWPLKITNYAGEQSIFFNYNLIFWIVIVIAILSLYKYFKNRKQIK